MKKEKPRGILFDKDGTLIDFETSWFPIVTSILDQLRQEYRLCRVIMDRLARTSGITSTGFVRESLIQSATNSNIAEVWSGICLEHDVDIDQKKIQDLFTQTSEKMKNRLSLVPGTKTLLSRLKNKGWKLGIATSDNRASTESGLENLGILHHFDYIASDGDGLPAKPFPDAALLFSRRFDIEPRTISVIGDSLSDMVFAQRAGARFIGMKTSCNSYQHFVKAGYPVVQDFSSPDCFEKLIA